MKKLLFCIICILVSSPSALATGQQPDILVYEGRTYKLFSNPLESFYKNEGERPSFVPATDMFMRSGNWRGYVATWEIRDGLLYLTHIQSWICNREEWLAQKCKKAELSELFGGKYIGGRVLADWYSGELRAPDGKMLEYVHMGYGSVYEREIVLSVDAGKVVKTVIVDNTKRRRPPNLEL